jgi:hypothetical protein
VPTIALLAAATQALLLATVILAERVLGTTWGLLTLLILLAAMLTGLAKLGFLQVDEPRS